MNIHTIRQVVLDTETTGMNKFGIHHKNHRVIEIGAIEIIDRYITSNKFHVYLNPERSVDPEAFQIHGISDQFLSDKPYFSDIMERFLTFISDSELIIHNASFDLGFLNQELINARSNCKKIESYCTIIDSLKIARQMFPGQRNSLDALCDRYSISNIKRVLHNALIDAQILANIFLLMTGGQITMDFIESNNMQQNSSKKPKNDMQQLMFNTTTLVNTNKKKSESLKIIYANQQEQLEHENYLNFIEKKINKRCIWKKN